MAVTIVQILNSNKLMKPLASHSDTLFKQLRLMPKISLSVLVFSGGTFLLYYGYCWGWWGRSNLLLQFIFQCKCPLSSNEFRYADYIDVILPACEYDNILISPNGKLLYVENNKESYFWNLQTGEKKLHTIPEGSRYFLTDELLFLRLDHNNGIEGGEYILNLTTGVQYPIQRFSKFYPDAYNNGKVNIEILAQKLKVKEQIYLVNDVIIALDTNISSENNFLTGWFDIPSDQIENFLLTYEISFIQIYVYPDYISEYKSPNGRFFIREEDGIYLIETNEKIVDENLMVKNDSYYGWDFSFYGWLYDSSGVFYAVPFGHGRCLLSFWLPGMDGSECLIEVPQPVLKLKVPQEYLDEAVP